MGRLPTEAATRMVLIDPSGPRRVYAASEAGLYRSDDAGQTWEQADRGLPEGGVRALALDPREPRRLYAAASGASLYLSEDGATSWQVAGTDLGARP